MPFLILKPLPKPMSHSPKRNVAAQPPETLSDLTVTAPATTSAGPRGVQTAMRHAREEMGLLHGLRVLRQVNQKEGFDCPGCAWPDPDERSRLGEYCENGAKAVAEEATRRRVTPAFFKEWSVEALAQQSDYWLGKQGRLTHPMILRKGSNHYEPIGWPEAFRLIAQHLQALESPDEAIFYTSGRTSNEAAFLYQLFARRFGTNNLPDCSNLCHESSGRALKEVIGIGKGTVTLDDFEQAELIFIVGQNPGTNHPRMLTTLQHAKKAGARIIHVNPLSEAGMGRFKHPQKVSGWLGSGTPIADMFVQVRINGDVALFTGIIKAVLEAEANQPGHALNAAFIDERTEGFAAMRAHIEALEWATLVEASGITQAQMEAVAQDVIASERIIICWAMGLTQHKNAVANIQSLVNLLLLRGSIGKPGAGVCPVRGHSNVQGDRTVGITSKPAAALLDRLEGTFGFAPPRQPGYDSVEAAQAMHDGHAKVFIALGGNFLSAMSDTEYTAAALQRCTLTVQISTKLNRSHLVTGEEALILPCLGRTERDVQAQGEQFVTVENSMGIVHTSQGHLAPASEHLLSEPALVAGLATATLGAIDPVDWHALVADYDAIRDLISQTIPGFDAYNTRVRQPGGFYLPNSVREGCFATPNGKAQFTSHPIEPLSLGVDQYLMMTIRTHDQYNTTIYGLDDRYRGLYGERRVVLLNPQDMHDAGLAQGDVVDLTSHFEGETRTVRTFLVVPYDLPRRCAATYFPEANPLIPITSTADKSNTPTSKSVVITLQQQKTY